MQLTLSQLETRKILDAFGVARARKEAQEALDGLSTAGIRAMTALGALATVRTNDRSK